MFEAHQVEALKAPLDRAHVKSRTQAGRTLSYLEGWVAIAEANRIFGYDAWDRETVDLRVVTERETKIGQAQKDGYRVAYIAKVRVRVLAGERVIVREGCGYGSGIDQDLGSAHESAVKESETDAMKRALMTFGNPFGLALYDKEQRNVTSGNGAQAPSPAHDAVPHNKTSRDLDWHGPLNKTKLADEMRMFVRILDKDVHIVEELDNLLETYYPILQQCEKDLPGWWSGEGQNADFVPIRERIDRKRKFLTAPAPEQTIIGAG